LIESQREIEGDLDDEEAEGIRRRRRRRAQQGGEGAQGQALHHPQMRRHAPLLARLACHC